LSQKGTGIAGTEETESIERIIEGPAFYGRMIWLLELPLPPPPSPGYTGRLRKRDKLLSGEERVNGYSRSRPIQLQESLVLYISFNTLWREVKTQEVFIT
jgi:hypothetical protein